MSDSNPATVQVEARLAALPPDQRAALQALRATIAGAAPDAVDAISYGAPAFRYHGRPLVAYAAYKAHCSLFPMSPELIERHLDELHGFVIAKGTVQFTPEHPLPTDLVARIVRERMVQIDAR
jgi:uncharacterized protein YdhG (YjbR/CyaY superfamily)